MRYEKWDIAGFDRDCAALLCNTGINPLVSVLLSSRGITDPPEAEAFINTDNITLHDPYLMKDMDKAVCRIKKAVDNKEKVAVFGDYDVDGMTSSALLALWLKSKGIEYEVYIPGRFDEGYSLNAGALDTLKANGAGLVVTVDCGIIASKEAKHAKKIGLDIIITDHHECKDMSLIPKAVAVVDPKRSDCLYPFKPLAGVGVVYKLICALEDNNIPPGDDMRYLQLVALGTVADVMPLLGENRQLTRAGLEYMQRSPIEGIKKLIAAASPGDSKISAATVGYTLAPRLNAAGRMSNPLLSVDLLLCDDSMQAEKYAQQLCKLNDERKLLEQEIFDSALEMLGGDKPDAPIILAGRHWNQGVTGIVASRMADRFNLPAIIVSINEAGIGRGSCRSSSDFSIYDALSSCADILLEFGGHNRAAGFDIEDKNIDILRRRIHEYYREAIKSSPAAGLKIDFTAEKPAKLLTPANIEALCCMEPFGSDNPAPRICIEGVYIADIISIGAGKHTKIMVQAAGSLFECIMFSVSSDRLGVKKGDLADIAFEPQINEFRDRRSVQLQLLDIRKAVRK